MSKLKDAQLTEAVEVINNQRLHIANIENALDVLNHNFSVQEQALQDVTQRESNLTLERTALFQALWDCQKERKLLSDKLKEQSKVSVIAMIFRVGEKNEAV